ncbi:hypothetical protein ACLOJK_017217 [Asimina triloba]
MESLGVEMATNSNSGFHHGAVPAAAFSHHAISFQSGAMNSSAGMILPTGSSRGMNSTAGMIPAGNSVGTSGARILLDTGPGLKHDAGLAADWSAEEQSLLEEGLVKYADEPSILRYIKIAAKIPDKTVRDVALRCRWMTMDSGKRRKSGEHYAGKKATAQLEALKARGKLNKVKRDKAEMIALFVIIRKTIQENIDLFICTRNNITAILNDMREMPGIMSQMPPLPVSLNEELANTIIPSSAQARSQASTLVFHDWLMSQRAKLDFRSLVM